MTDAKEKKQPIFLPATLDGFTPRKDGSFTLRYLTGDIPDDKFLLLRKNLGFYGLLAFIASEQPNLNDLKGLQDAKIDQFDRGLSQSKRLRNVLFVYWKQNKADTGYTEFDRFYLHETEKLIKKYKAKLR